MEESILRTIRAMCGYDTNDDTFDTELIVFINARMLELYQMGVGTEFVFRVTGEDEEWKNFINDQSDFEAVKDYIFAKCKLVFDPPTNATVVELYKEEAKEARWRLMEQSATKSDTEA